MSNLAVVRIFAIIVSLFLSLPAAFAQAGADAARPGDLVHSERMVGGPPGGDAWRVLYRSTDPSGSPVEVSGVVILPKAVMAGAGRPIVAWAHPTSGVVQACAPSLAHFLFQQISGLRAMLDRGYIIAATDYPGLGTPGPHPFLVGESEGRAVLDIARAAKQLAGADAGRKIALWGHSQGGQAVLFAARLAPTYAPDLAIAGVAAAAPATDLAALLKDDVGTPGGDNLLAMTLWAWSRYYVVSLSGIVEPSAVPVVDRLAQVCLESPIDILPRRRIGAELMQSFLIDPTFIDREPWRRLIAENSVGTLPPSMPVLLVQGTADDTVRPSVTHSYAERLCADGSPVTYLALPGVGHGLVAHDAVPALVDWLSARFASQPAPSSCGSL